MKKVLSISTLLISFITLASAQGSISSGLSGGMRNLVYTIENLFRPFFTVLLGGDDGFLFERVMFFMIVIAIVYIITSRMPVFDEKKAIIWIITLSVSILSTRYLVESSLVQSMLLPYSALGISLTAALPMLIYFAFVQSFENSATIRKMLWIFFITIFFGIWAARYQEVGEFAWIYLITALLALIFLLADGTIRRVILRQQQAEWDADSKEDHLVKLRKERDLIVRNHDKYTNETRFKRALRKIDKVIEEVRNT